MITGDWAEKAHRWTEEEVAFAAECWARGLTQDQTANAIADKFDFIVSRNSISMLTRTRRERFPRRVPAREVA